MSRNWTQQVPPYEGDQPYIYFAFAEADRAKVWKILRPLLERGCRIWYSVGPAGSASEVLRRQERSAGAALTMVYLTDAACADKDTKSFVLVNQKFGRRILGLDPDGTDRRLAMGLRESVVHVPLYQMKDAAEIESAITHAEGFSLDVVGEPVAIGSGNIVGKLTLTFLVLAVLLGAAAFAGARYLNWFRPAAQDEILIEDPALQSAVRQALRGGAITEETLSEVTFLRFGEIPESWNELTLLPALERIELPQDALLADEPLPGGDYVIELSGGGE